MTILLLAELAAVPLAAASALIAYLVVSLGRAARILASHEQVGHFSAALVRAEPGKSAARPIHARAQRYGSPFVIDSDHRPQCPAA